MVGSEGLEQRPFYKWSSELTGEGGGRGGMKHLDKFLFYGIYIIPSFTNTLVRSKVLLFNK